MHGRTALPVFLALFVLLFGALVFGFLHDLDFRIFFFVSLGAMIVSSRKTYSYRYKKEKLHNRTVLVALISAVVIGFLFYTTAMLISYFAGAEVYPEMNWYLYVPFGAAGFLYLCMQLYLRLKDNHVL